MATYAIGDVQGCLQPLLRLLDKIDYSPERDRLLFAGDLVNRGKESLAALRFIMQLPSHTVCVLGNHDLSLLTAAFGFFKPGPKHTIQEILTAPDKPLLMEWLRHCPLLYHDSINNYTLTHAGIFLAWDITQAKALAHEAENVLRGENFLLFLENLFGDEPVVWQASLTGWPRLRFIINAFTRMRFCTINGALDLSAKGSLEQHPDLLPWFAVPHRATKDDKLLFGHWAALQSVTPVPNIFPLDSGCVWGNALTAFCLETQQYYRVTCDEYVKLP